MLVRVSPTSTVGPGTSIGEFSLLGYPRSERKQFEGSGDDEAFWATSQGCTIGANVKIAPRVFVGEGSIVEDESSLGESVYVGYDSELNKRVEVFHRAQIHDRVIIGQDSWIGGFICNDAKVGSRSVIYGKLIHRFVEAVVGVPEPPPEVGEDAFVGEGAIIIGGITIGSGAYVAAGSIVTKSVPEGALVAGNPARIVGKAPKAFKDYESRFPR